MPKNKKTQPAAGSGVPETPYLAGRREWMERYGGYIQSAQQWRIVGLGSLLITAIAVAGMVYSASQNHFNNYQISSIYPVVTRYVFLKLF